jgi:hypothetical protein
VRKTVCILECEPYKIGSEGKESDTKTLDFTRFAS